ncbi:MAG: hypothetical protein KDD62_05145, partial [Bdellovibrionales bacterium]|nr:hypothetical protein [Bdellovibrionales bacterium]
MNQRLPSKHSLLHYLKPGPLLYHLLYYPRRFAHIASTYGWGNYLSAKRGQRTLPAKLAEVGRVPFAQQMDVSFSFLTGSKFWDQTALCALSLTHALQAVPQFTIVSDGSLQEQQMQVLKDMFGDIRFVGVGTSEEIVEHKLPRERYPQLRGERDQYVLMRKLLDVQLVAPGSIYLDSDMIFWDSPTDLLELYNRRTPFFMSEASVPQDLGLFASSTDLYKHTGIFP